MANTKITELTQLANPVSTDVLTIVDVAADVTKKISIADLLKNASAGTAAAPGIAFDGDSNTGFFSAGPDQLGAATGGIQRLIIDGSGNIALSANTGSFRIIGVANSSNTTLLLQGGAASGTGGNIELGSNKNIVYDGDTHEFRNVSGVSEFARIDSSGRLLIGASTAQSVAAVGLIPQLQLNSSSSSQSQSTLGIFANSATNNGRLGLFRNRATTAGGFDYTGGTVQADDILGQIDFYGVDGQATPTMRGGAIIQAVCESTPTIAEMPTRLVFSVTADGALFPTEAMRIKNTRVINFSNAPVYADNAAAKTGGLVDGDVYRTSTGDLKIVYT